MRGGVSEPGGGAAMRAEELLQLVHHRPFRPFRVHLKDGRTAEVLYPHLAMVGVEFFDLGIPTPEDPEPFICERIESYYLPHIERIELLDQPAPGKN
jgi:hypothetical protein